MRRVNALRRSGFLHFSALVSLVWACSSSEATPAGVAQAGNAGTSAGAPDQGGEGASPQKGGSSSGGNAGAAESGAAGEAQVGGAGGVAGSAAGAGGAGGEPPKPECVEAADCTVPETKPAGCAEAKCDAGKCAFSARDADGDGYLAKRCQSLDANVDIATGDDCDDADKNTNPKGWDGPAGDGHANGCNDGIDQDCSGIVDDGVTSASATCTCAPNDTQPCGATAAGVPIDYPLLGADGKPVGTCKFGSRECLPNGTWGACTNAVGPVDEVCDGKNNDCDALTDEDAVNPPYIYCDADGDNHIAATSTLLRACQPTGACQAWRSFTKPATIDDCDDADAKNYPGNSEICDGQDNNCDGIVDGATVSGDLKKSYYRDADGDGYGADASLMVVCDPPGTGWVLNTKGDCSDDLQADPDAKKINPVGHEICNGKDDDCDGKTDAADTLEDTPAIAGTEFACQGGVWKITKCPADTLACDSNLGNGCETDATTLSNCRSCNNKCFFDCGSIGCNEVVGLAAGLSDGCAVTQEGSAWCWGGNAKGKLGDNTTTNRNNPTAVSGIVDVKLIAAGDLHSCAATGSTSALYCWGDDTHGQLGSAPVSTESHTPVTANSLVGVVSLALGAAHSCAVLASGAVDCWGQNNVGQVGNGATLPGADVGLPGNVADTNFDNLAGATQVVAGALHSCALLSDKTVVCWGGNASKQLGNAGGNAAVATPVAGLTGVTQLSAGYSHTCALASGKVYCWGSNNNDEVGQTGAGPYASPQLVPSLTDAIAVAAGFETTCVIRTGGTVECWGGNTSGARGDAPGAASATRVVVGITKATMIVAGTGNQMCALRSTGDAYCWGDNSSFQLGKSGASTNVPQLLVQ